MVEVRGENSPKYTHFDTGKKMTRVRNLETKSYSFGKSNLSFENSGPGIRLTNKGYSAVITIYISYLSIYVNKVTLKPVRLVRFIALEHGFFRRIKAREFIF